MSIWCTWEHIGTDPRAWRDADTDEAIPKHAERGNVLSYAAGFSNHYPDLTGEHERPATVAIASIPVWCVPGHDEENDDELGPWLRLEVAAPETLNHWVKDVDGKPQIEPEGASVVLDEEAARSLRDDLSAWLGRAKAMPA